MLRETPTLLPPHYFVASIAAMLAIALWRWQPGFNAWQLPGLAVITLGVVIAVSGSRQFARAKTNIVPLQPASTLVTDGVFRFSRNPMYLGMLLALLGLAWLLAEPLCLGVAALFFFVIRLVFIPAEEKQMAATFGAYFAAYHQRVRRWL
ncbi:MAG: isoprenylcysteine carboxylmethyltransferase family protein [Pseudomonadaceae bacterium]|nr:isoprenylcysteine carboxylmethyltransferase family protein [Pseudomonadaceae bacterium]